ncbi:MAG: Uma2 family endonuclease [Symploca sp. SIO1C4]|uniref:Uma2 family endonuclease n=1 Tax=Symploca sp. SIO1C4 TaxID=2607765 RepID=A0A6B3NGS2_9CYAN|nr:Uma2 family endonuclease [Symploca sp. SIO1C4]
MIQAIHKQVTFDEFIARYPIDGRYELIDGQIIEIQPTGKHEEVTEFLSRQLILEAAREQLPYRFPSHAIVKAPSWETDFLPDVLIANPSCLKNEPLWEKAATITSGKSILLVVEVVGTNWAIDYARKLEDYEAMGIPEYWIVDYLGLGGRRYIGIPKHPTVLVCQLIDSEYQVKLFRKGNVISSTTFPSLNLTVDQIFRAGD